MAIKSFSNKILVEGQMNHGLIKINIPSDVAQFPGEDF